DTELNGVGDGCVTQAVAKRGDLVAVVCRERLHLGVAGDLQPEQGTATRAPLIEQRRGLVQTFDTLALAERGIAKREALCLDVRARESDPDAGQVVRGCHRPVQL